MFIDALLLVFLVATLLLGIKLQLDLNKLPLHKEEFENSLKKSQAQLEGLEKLVDRFKYINQSDKESFQRLTEKAKATKDELSFLIQKSENIFQKLNQLNTINVENFLDKTTNKQPEQLNKDQDIKVNIKKNKLLNRVKDLR